MFQWKFLTCNSFHALTTKASMYNILGLSCWIQKELSPRMRYLRGRHYFHSCKLERTTVWWYGTHKINCMARFVCHARSILCMWCECAPNDSQNLDPQKFSTIRYTLSKATRQRFAVKVGNRILLVVSIDIFLVMIIIATLLHEWSCNISQVGSSISRAECKPMSAITMKCSLTSIIKYLLFITTMSCLFWHKVPVTCRLNASILNKAHHGCCDIT